MDTDTIVDGAKAGGAAVGGSLLLGPTIGAPVAGFAVDNFMDGSGYTEAGVAVGLAFLLIGSNGGSARADGGRK